jgi:hypothetical protein
MGDYFYKPDSTLIVDCEEILERVNVSKEQLRLQKESSQIRFDIPPLFL